MIKTLRRFSISILFVLLLVFSINVFSSDVTYFAGGRYYVSERIAENNLPYGIKHYKDIAFSSVTENSNYRPQQVNVLEIPSSDNIKIIPWADISPSKWNLSPLTKIVSDYEKNNPGYKVVAAINGDFFDIDKEENFACVPEGVHIAHGNLYKSSHKPAANIIGFKNDGSNHPLVGNVPFERSENMFLDIYQDEKIIKQFEINKINENPEEGEIAVFFAIYNDNQELISQSVTDGYIVENAEYALPHSESDFYGLGKISKVGSEKLKVGQFALVCNNEEVGNYLSLGTKIRVQYQTRGEFSGVNDALGVREIFLYDGKFTGKDNNIHPRTLIGMKEDGTIVMTVVDGRQESKGMYGVQSIEMATIMTHYGAVEGYNLDGGGSSTMVIFKNGKHEVVNSPSGGYQRSDANGIVVAVKVPHISYQVTNISKDSVEISAEVISKNGYDFDKLYVGIGNEIKEVVDGKATFTNLNSNQEYTYTFYQKIDEEYKSLIVADTVTTAKEEPIINGVYLSYANNRLVVEVDIFDPDKAIMSNMIYINNKFAGVIDGKANFYNFDGNFDNIYINYTYDLNDGKGSHNIKLIEFEIKCDFKCLMKMMIYKINNRLISIYH
ncbi:MAG TPA: phosphodiester glycosidase family protein [Acholeplasmataceae bacterium]|nr:phosphodiester glycosidase family protein [Acholeplasmataceae bacterium]